jgi:hypothetical protein
MTKARTPADILSEQAALETELAAHGEKALLEQLFKTVASPEILAFSQAVAFVGKAIPPSNIQNQISSITSMLSAMIGSTTARLHEIAMDEQRAAEDDETARNQASAAAKDSDAAK